MYTSYSFLITDFTIWANFVFIILAVFFMFVGMIELKSIAKSLEVLAEKKSKKE